VSALQGINLDDEIKFEDIDLTLLKGISLQPGDESHVIFRASGGVEGQAYYVELNEAIKKRGFHQLSLLHNFIRSLDWKGVS
jgi:hypothetical protein